MLLQNMTLEQLKDKKHQWSIYSIYPNMGVLLLKNNSCTFKYKRTYFLKYLYLYLSTFFLL